MFSYKGLFSGNAFEKIDKTPINQIIVTNTIPAREGEEKCDKIVRLSVGKLYFKTCYK